MNKRRNKRKACFVPVEAKSGTSMDHTQVVDISRRGIGFVTKESVALNKRVMMELDLDSNGESVIVTGRVRWVRKLLNSKFFRLGLEFDEVIAGSTKTLNKI